MKNLSIVKIISKVIKNWKLKKNLNKKINKIKKN